MTTDQQSTASVEPNAGRKGEGTMLNERFELIRRVGAGGMGTVYKALDRHNLVLDNRACVAIKVLNRRFHADPRQLAALQQQVERCQQMVHPNIVRVYEFHRDGATAYISMEYLYGEPLTARIRSEDFTRMDAAEALSIIDAMGQALAYAHSQGIVHCDFKPANVFLTETGEVKLIDFGIARAFRQADDADTEGGSGAEPLGALSPAYASPDILEGGEADPRDDVYALACTAYELLTGAHPFDYKPATEARAEWLVVARQSGLTHGQWQALCRGLAFDREQRTATVEHFLEQLNAGRSVWRPQRVYIAAGLAASLLAVVGMFAWYSGKLPEGGSNELQPSLISGATRPADVGDDVVAGPPRPELQPSPISDAARSADVGDDVVAEPPSPAAEQTDSAAPVTEGVETEGEVEGPSTLAVETEASQEAESSAADAENTNRIATVSKLSSERDKAMSAEQRVAELMARAERQIAAKHLTTPTGDAALETYQQVLELAPGHKGAEAGIGQIKGQYQAWAEADKRRGRWQRAHANLDKALAIDPEDSNLVAALVGLELVRDELKLAQKRTEEKIRRMEETQAPSQAKPSAERIAKAANVSKPVAPKPRSPIVINEFMASNNDTIADSSGGYDDWIELYNPSPDTVDLSGHYLSNDAKNGKKWRFPDGTRIPPYGYLLVWADRGSSNPREIHANFELSVSGGEILLSDPDGGPVDYASYARQPEDHSTRRSPNGMGRFGRTRVASPGLPN